MKNLIVPMAGTSVDLPIEFQYNKKGVMKCIESLQGIDLNYFDTIYFVFTSEAEEKWSVRDQLMIQVNKLRQSNKLNAKVRLIEIEPTSSQAETIYNTIKQCNIKGYIFIKDADNMCTIQDMPAYNSVCVYSLEDCSIVDPQHKSYVMIDDNMFITNIIETKVVSNYFNCGGYIFENADDYVQAYEECRTYEQQGKSHLRLSHIIYYLILFKKQIFRPVIATDYFDFALE